MIISPDTSQLAHSCLRCWDQHDTAVTDIVWFNPDAMVCSARVRGGERRAVVGRFVFLAVLKTTAERLRGFLPEHLHQYIEDTPE